MKLSISDDAAALVERSLKLAGLDPSSAGVRLRVARSLGGSQSIQVELADAPSDGDEVFMQAGARVFVDPTAGELHEAATLDVEPEHERLVVRAADG